MEAIEEGAADFAVLPIENSSAGAVNEVYDLLVEFENYIVGETFLPIENTLAGLPGTTLSQIERVYSKAEALMQTSRFLEKHGDWQQISVSNTAAADKKSPKRAGSLAGGSVTVHMQHRYTDFLFWQRILMMRLIM